MEVKPAAQRRAEYDLGVGDMKVPLDEARRGGVCPVLSSGAVAPARPQVSALQSVGAH
jgi:hypothetical protein